MKLQSKGRLVTDIHPDVQHEGLIEHAVGVASSRGIALLERDALFQTDPRAKDFPDLNVLMRQIYSRNPTPVLLGS
jgi:hypothetical protein